jgi:hypothetical protein
MAKMQSLGLLRTCENEQRRPLERVHQPLGCWGAQNKKCRSAGNFHGGDLIGRFGVVVNQRLYSRGYSAACIWTCSCQPMRAARPSSVNA